MDYFNYATGLTMTNERFAALFGAPARTPEPRIAAEQRQMDIARSIQAVTEEVVLRLATQGARGDWQTDYLCSPAAWRSIAWPTAASCAKARSGTSGSSRPRAMPAARWARRWWPGMSIMDQPRTVDGHDAMAGSYLGPGLRNEEIHQGAAGPPGAVYEELAPGDVPERLAAILADENVVGWFQGRMEFGPRARWAAVRSSAIRAARRCNRS